MKNNIVRKSMFLMLGLLPTTLLLAQNEAASTTGSSTVYNNLALYILGGIALIVIISALLILLRLLNAMIKVKELEIFQEKGLEAFVVEKSAPREPAWETLYKRFTKVVPVEREEEILLDHDYDGIQELDNILPPWWLGMFYVTIVIGVLYFGYYHIAGKGLSSSEAWEVEMAKADESVQAYLASQSDMVDETNVELLTDAGALEAGKTTFNTLCAVCHLENGAGSVGPNMTDNYWLHGGDIKDLFKTIKYGVPEKGMISWKSQLRPSQMQEVSSYILTNLVGTNPPNPKEPQGELYEPEKI